MTNRKIETKYFVVKMKQEINIDYFCAKLLELIPYGDKGYKIVKFEDIAQIFLDSMILNDGEDIK